MADGIQTVRMVHRGGCELNPVMDFLMSHIGLQKTLFLTQSLAVIFVIVCLVSNAPFLIYLTVMAIFGLAVMVTTLNGLRLAQ